MNDFLPSTSRIPCECPKCHDSGWILEVGNDGNTKARRCECYYIARAERINEKSGFPASEYGRMTFETFKTDTEEQKKMLALAKEFVEKGGSGAGFFGKSGTGKTHICIAICQALTRKTGMVHRYFSYRKEMHNLQANYYKDEMCSEKLADWGECDILYIDDLLKLSENNGEYDRRELQIFYELLNQRALNHKITIFSSERSLKEINTVDEAIGSRIYEMIYPYAMKCEGANYRLGRKER